MKSLIASQNDIYVEQQIFEGLPMFNIGGYAVFKQIIDVELFKQAQTLLENRFDIFGLRFGQSDGKPVQSLQQERNAIQFLDFSDDSTGEISLEGDTPKKRALARLNQLYSTCFDLHSDILYQTCLFKLSEQEYWYVCLAHHLITDGWGYTLWLKDVCKIYANLVAGASDPKRTPLDGLTSINYLEAMDTLKPAKNPDKDLQFWRRQLADLPPLLFDKIASKTELHRDYKSYRQTLSISQELASYWRHLSIEKGQVSLQSLLLGAIGIYFAQTKNQRKLLVGQPLHNRSSAVLKNSYGNFLSMGVSRVDFESDWTVEELLRDLYERKRAEFRHQKITSAQLNELANYDRSERSLLFDIELNYQRLSYTIDADGVDGDTHFWYSQFQKTPLIVTLCDYGEHQDLELHIDYQYHVFGATGETSKAESQININAREANAFAQRLVALMDWQVSHLASPVHRAPVVIPQDIELWQQANQHWLSTESSPGVNEQAFTKLLKKSTAFSQSIQDSQGILPGNDLRQQILHTASYLAHHGVGAGDRVVISVQRSRNLPVWIFALWRLGAVYVPMATDLPQGRIAYILADCQPKGIVCDNPQTLPQNLQARCITSQFDEQSVETFADLWQFDNNTTAYIIYTSGTTGDPKGVSVSHGAFASFLNSMEKVFNDTNTRHWLASTTIGFDISLLELIYPVLFGHKLFVAPENIFQQPETLVALLNQHLIDVVQATPTAWNILTQSGWEPFKDRGINLRLLTGGEALNTDLAQKLSQNGNQIFNLYGPTEATVWATVSEVKTNTPVTIGHALSNTQAYVVNAQGTLLPPYAKGELVLAGDCLAQGYWNKPELSNSKFTQIQLMPGRTESVYKTGDVCYLNHKAQLVYAGRDDRQVKLRGVRIELSEIEARLRKLPDIENALVLLKMRPGSNRKELVAYVQSQQEQSASALQAALKNHLPGYMIPSLFISLSVFPTNSSGKVTANLMPPVIWEASVANAPVDGQLENQLRQLLQQTLGHNNFSVDDNFFDMGATSLDVVNFTKSVNQVLAQQLLTVDVFANPSIGQLATYLEKESLENPVNSPHSKASQDNTQEMNTEQSVTPLPPQTALSGALKKGKSRLAARRRKSQVTAG